MKALWRNRDITGSQKIYTVIHSATLGNTFRNQARGSLRLLAVTGLEKPIPGDECLKTISESTQTLQFVAVDGLFIQVMVRSTHDA